MLSMNYSLRWLSVLPFLCAAAVAQQSPSAQPESAPVSYASVSQLNTLLAQLEQTSSSIQADMGRLRIEHWKTDGNSKRVAQANVESIQRNLQTALPAMIMQLRASPEDLNGTFKLYRNLDALYDVVGSVVEMAGAFGGKDEFQSLGNDYNALEATRRGMADRLDTLTQAKEIELARLRTQVHSLQAAIPPPAPKKIIVDDDEDTPKKPAPKKRSTTHKSTAKPATTPAKPPAQQ